MCFSVLHAVRDFFPCFIVFLRVLRGAINRSEEQTETKVWHHNGVKVGWSTTVVVLNTHWFNCLGQNASSPTSFDW